VLLRLSVLAAGLAGAVPASAATIVNFNGGSGALPQGTAVIQDFERNPAGTAIGTKAAIYASNVSGESARPAFGSTGGFGVVRTGGSYSIDFAPTGLFAFVLGSLDTYNKLTLRYADGGTLALSGGQIINGASFPSGNQVSGLTNGVVSYRVDGGLLLTGATFTSTGNSFEFDTIAVAAVPEPETWALLIGGFGLVGFGLRRRRRPETAPA
jgi:hypothetical protein